MPILTKCLEFFSKYPTLKFLNTSAFFIIVYLIGWTINAIYPNIKFDLPAIRDFYIIVVGKQAVEHGVNSIFNSEMGKPIIKGECSK